MPYELDLIVEENECELDFDIDERVETLNGATFILRDEEGTEVVAVAVEEKTVFTATANDIRRGTVAATEEGVTLGDKFIPSYHTTVGYRFISKGKVFETPSFIEDDKYDFTKLQALICPFNKSISASVATEAVAINEGVYAVNSTERISTVIKDSETKRISLGIVNESNVLYLLRYFTYKEIN